MTLPLINPVITYREGSKVDIEGCLSFPNLKRKVSRPTFIKVTFYKPNGEQLEIEADGLDARIICHEVDHLNGICRVGYKKG